MGPATTGPSDVTTYLTVVMALMRQIAHSNATQACFHAVMEYVFLSVMSVIMTMTVEIEATSKTAHILRAEGITSPAPVAVVSTKSGFVTERMIARTMLMKKAVITFPGSVTQGNGHVHLLAYVSPWISCVMGCLIVQRGRMKPTPLLGAIAVSGDVPL